MMSGIKNPSLRKLERRDPPPKGKNSNLEKRDQLQVVAKEVAEVVVVAKEEDSMM